jgi:hypothetical protein
MRELPVQTHWLRFIGGPVILAVLTLSTHAAEPGDAHFSATVKLTVSASDSIKEPVTSCLTRELRALDHVRLVSDQPDWEISALALEVQSTRGYRGGIAISTVMVSRFQNEPIAPLFQPAQRGPGLAQTSNLWEYPFDSLNMDASDRLQTMCKQIAADFDAKQLEKSRNRFREMRKSPRGDRQPQPDGAAKSRLTSS